MKRILVLLMIAAVVIISGCAIETPPAENIFAEAADSTNDTTAETTTFTLDNAGEYRISGTFDSATDDDKYLVPLNPGLQSVSFRVSHLGEEVLADIILEINNFPFTVSFLDADGYSVGTIYIYAASGDATVDVPATATEMSIVVFAETETLLGTSIPYGSGDYFIQFSAY